MTAPAAVQPFDPRHARGLSAEARRVADRWLKDAAVRMNETFAEFGIEAKVSLQTIFTQDARTALSNLADPDAAESIALGFLQDGWTDVYLIDGGFEAYVRAGGKTEPARL